MLLLNNSFYIHELTNDVLEISQNNGRIVLHSSGIVLMQVLKVLMSVQFTNRHL